MTITTTGIAFSISSIGLAFCGFRFFKSFQKIGGLRSGSRIGIFLSTFYLGLSFQHAVLAIGGLFLANTPEALYAVLIIDHFILALITAFGMYLALYILLPNFSPWPATIVTLVFGLFVVGLTIVGHPLPFITAAKSIDWNMPHWVQVPWYYLLILSIGIPFVIFAKNFFSTKVRDTKIVSLIIMGIQFLGMINVSLLFSHILVKNSGFRTGLFDSILSIIGLLFVGAFLIAPIITGWRSEIRKK